MAFGRIKFEVYKYLKNIAPKSAFDISPDKIVESMKKIGIVISNSQALSYKNAYITGDRRMMYKG